MSMNCVQLAELSDNSEECPDFMPRVSSQLQNNSNTTNVLTEAFGDVPATSFLFR